MRERENFSKNAKSDEDVHAPHRRDAPSRRFDAALAFRAVIAVSGYAWRLGFTLTSAREAAMGLLDDLLGGLAGQPAGGRMPQPRMGAQAGGGSMSSILMALMPVVLSMLSNQGAQRGMPGQMSAAPGGGGLGDILGQVLGGAAGGRGAAGGGLGGILAQLQQAGFGEQADSWVSPGANKPIPPDAMTQIFGRDGLQQISRHAGLTEEETSHGLSQLLPEVVDRVTPGGQVPDFDALTNSVDDLARQFGVR